MSKVETNTGGSNTGMGASLLESLKKKMRQYKEEAEKARDDADEAKKLYTDEKKKREEVSHRKCPLFDFLSFS